MTKTSTVGRIFHTDLERMNASRQSWDLFQRRNQASEHSSSVLLYPSFRKNISHSFSARSKLANYSSILSSQQFPHPLKLLHTTASPEFPIRMPQFPPEHPFDMHAIFVPSVMLRLLGNQNYIPEFMSLRKPLEAVLYPHGQLAPVRFAKWHVDRHDYGSSELKSTPSAALSQGESVSKQRDDSSKWTANSDLHKRLQTMGYDFSSIDQPHTVYHFRRPLRGSRSSQQNPRRKLRRTRLKLRVRQALRRLLTDYTACPVHYRWRDWGPRFWPRWIKEGSCVDLGQTSCSIPPGMFCTEAEHRSIVVLRFLCFTSWPRSSCSWFRLRFPILSRCQCGCSNRPKKGA